MKIYYKTRKIEVSVKKLSFFGKITGLMFKTKFYDNLLFEFNKKTNMGIHSYFVFFNFLAIWLDDKNNVIDWKIVKPFNPLIRPNKSFFKLVEIPLNKNNKRIIKFFVGRGKI